MTELERLSHSIAVACVTYLKIGIVGNWPRMSRLGN